MIIIKVQPAQYPYIRSTLCSLIDLPARGIPRYDVTNVKFEKVLPLNNPLPRPLIITTSNGNQSFVSKWSPIPNDQKIYQITEEFHSTVQNTSSYITMVNCFTNGQILFGYFDGTLELRSSQLGVIQTIYPKTSSQKVKKFYEGQELMDLTGSSDGKQSKSFPSPLSLAVSPNSTIFCVLDYSSTVNLYIRENPIFAPNLQQQVGYLLGRALANQMELSLVLGISYWDIILFFRDVCERNTEQFIRSVINWLMQDFYGLSDDSKQFYYSKFQGLYSALLRISENQITNHMDCQARLFVDYIYDTFNSCFRQVKILGGNI